MPLSSRLSCLDIIVLEIKIKIKCVKFTLHFVVTWFRNWNSAGVTFSLVFFGQNKIRGAT